VSERTASKPEGSARRLQRRDSRMLGAHRPGSEGNLASDFENQDPVTNTEPEAPKMESPKLEGTGADGDGNKAEAPKSEAKPDSKPDAAPRVKGDGKPRG